MDNDNLSIKKIEKFLIYKNVSKNIDIYQSITSTNDKAKELIKTQGNNKTIIIANQQTNGRGTRGKSFFSPQDSGIYISLILKNMITTSLITVASSVAVSRAIKLISGIDVGIKWVNDIYIDSKKICGILAENLFYENENYIVLGIGINISTDNFPKEIEKIAASLSEYTKNKVSKNKLIAYVINEIFEIVSNFDKQRIIDEYKQKSVVLGKQISFTQNEVIVNARAIDIDNDGGLIVELKDKSFKTLISSQISIKGDF